MLAISRRFFDFQIRTRAAGSGGDPKNEIRRGDSGPRLDHTSSTL